MLHFKETDPRITTLYMYLIVELLNISAICAGVGGLLQRIVCDSKMRCVNQSI